MEPRVSVVLGRLSQASSRSKWSVGATKTYHYIHHSCLADRGRRGGNGERKCVGRGGGWEGVTWMYVRSKARRRP
jgi:hypothetical protein